jgi:hypothetical protein
MTETLCDDLWCERMVPARVQEVTGGECKECFSEGLDPELAFKVCEFVHHQIAADVEVSVDDHYTGGIYEIWARGSDGSREFVVTKHVHEESLPPAYVIGLEVVHQWIQAKAEEHFDTIPNPEPIRLLP